ncbi:MAG: hypothetical protein JNL10_07170 [Verrucomicrobiales bacterium]|nr:hypothetical protein [Verrucomicrobiales bacterium]
MHLTAPRWIGAALAGAALLLPIVPSASAQEKKAAPNYFEDSFPFQMACINAAYPSNNTAMKGIAIRVGNDATVLFDTDLCRMAAGWTGGFISSHGVAFDGAHGHHPAMVGTQKFGVGNGPGVAGPDGSFADLRKEPYGPMDPAIAKWEGLFLNGNNVLLNYSVAGGTQVAEQPGSLEAGDQTVLTRTVRLVPPRRGFFIFKSRRTPEPFSIAVADVTGTATSQAADDITVVDNGTATRVSASGLPSGAALALRNGRIVLEVPKGTPPSTVKLALWSGPEAGAASVAGAAAKAADLADYTHGGPRRWTEAVKVAGKLETSASPDGAYVTDSITAPDSNPWNRRVRFGGFDFFPDGRSAAFCTHDGDIWIVKGIDGKLENLEWTRFASGLYEPLGLVIVDGIIYTSGRDGITRYRDLNGDGEADEYQAFNHDIMSTEGFHEFVFDLHRDNAGNFYYAKANPVNGGGRGFGDQKASRGNGTVCSHAGCLFKVSPDGSKFEVVARGFRAPNGIGVRPDGQVTTSDNEGTWVPTTPLNWVDGTTFHGVQNNLTSPDVAAKFAPPILWLSHNDYDNSGGGQIWVTSDQWGPFKGELLHESYGKSSLYLVMRQELPDGRQQAAATKFPLKFTSSVMRGRWGPVDQQLYIAGLSEWQSNAAKQTGFDRVRYTGKPVYSVRGVKVVPGGVELSFTQPLDKASAEDLQNWSGKRWNYVRSENYGSPEIGVSDPNKKGRESINITGARLGADGRTVTLTIENLKPVMQQSIKWDLKAADGTKVAQEIQQTIHEIPGQPLSMN